MVAPLDRVKLLNQAGQSAGAVSTLHKVLFNEGFRALWRGNTINVVRMVPNKMVLLSCSDLYKDLLQPLGLSTMSLGGTAGALSGATATALTYPLDLARTRIAGYLVRPGGKAPYTSLLPTLRAIVQEEGWLAIFRGVSPTVLGALPYEGIKFGVYDQLKAQLPEEQRRSALCRAAVGGVAVTLAHILTYPNDTIRRRLQMQGAGGEALLYHGYADCVRKLVAREGWRALYAGLGVTIVRGVPNTSIQFFVYEWCKDMLEYADLLHREAHN